MNKNSIPYKILRKTYQLFVHNLFYETLLLGYGRKKHRQLLKTSERKNDHTYTSFYRSPMQLDLLCGPVLDYIAKGVDEKLTINLFAGSNGSEAYTVASTLLAKHPDLNFHIYASDLHQEMVDKANSATYSMHEITQGLQVAESFIKQTFDKSADDQYKVKDSIRQHVSFEQADLLSDTLNEQFDKADIVFAQNVLFHMPQDLARRAFAKIATFLKPHSVLFIDGMEIEMRVELIKKENLMPLEDNLRQIYMYSRKHIAVKWWNYYWGNEPFSSFARDKAFRYGTIFLKNSK